MSCASKLSTVPANQLKHQASKNYSGINQKLWMHSYAHDFFFFQALNFLVECFGLLNDLFQFPSNLDAGYPVFDPHLAEVLFDVILPSVLGSSL
jgi:hypothetical protein